MRMYSAVYCKRNTNTKPAKNPSLYNAALPLKYIRATDENKCIDIQSGNTERKKHLNIQL